MDLETAVGVAIVVGAAATAGGVIVTSILNIRSNKLTRRGLEQEQEIAQASAGRAEAAAALNEEYTRRMVDALESIAAGGIGGAPPAAKVQWELVHDAGDTYRLTNVGDLDALGIELESHETLPLRNIEGGPDLAPGEAMTFMGLRMLGTTDSTITVTWREEPEGEEQMWRYPLPARAPRR